MLSHNSVQKRYPGDHNTRAVMKVARMQYPGRVGTVKRKTSLLLRRSVKYENTSLRCVSTQKIRFC